MDDGEIRFASVNDTMELAFNYRYGQHQPGAPAAPDACVACHGGRRPALMRRVSDWLITKEIGVDFLAWKINREVPGAQARVSNDGTLLVEGCALSVVVFSDIIAQMLPLRLNEAGETQSESLLL